MNRHLTLEGVDNFRDFGGYRTADGRTLRRGLLYRSASHSRATDADLTRLADLEIAVVVDLRSKDERAREPSRRPPTFSGAVIEAVADGDEEDSWREHVASSALSAESFRAYLIDYYRQAPFNSRHIDLFTRYFDALAHCGGPVLIHCAAGKDRTGLLAALTHHLVGVHGADIVSDYLLTNDPQRMAERLPMVSEAIRELSGRAPDPAAVMTIMGVDETYLDTAMGVIEARFGSTDAYLERALGITPQKRDSIRARLLE